MAHRSNLASHGLPSRKQFRGLRLRNTTVEAIFDNYCYCNSVVNAILTLGIFNEPRIDTLQLHSSLIKILKNLREKKLDNVGPLLDYLGLPNKYTRGIQNDARELLSDLLEREPELQNNVISQLSERRQCMECKHVSEKTEDEPTSILSLELDSGCSIDGVSSFCFW